MARIEQSNGLAAGSEKELTAAGSGPDSAADPPEQHTDKYGFMGGAQQYSGQS